MISEISQFEWSKNFPTFLLTTTLEKNIRPTKMKFKPCEKKFYNLLYNITQKNEKIKSEKIKIID